MKSEYEQWRDELSDRPRERSSWWLVAAAVVALALGTWAIRCLA